MLNWAVYSYNVNRSQIKLNESNTCSANNQDEKISNSDFISITDLFVPMTLSLLLSLIHSQIVATSSANLSKSDKLNQSPFQHNRRKRERKKRRKSTRSRSTINTLETKIRTNNLCDENNEIDTNETITGRLADEQQQKQQQKQNDTNYTMCSSSGLRKRNVNWCSPINSNSNESNGANVKKQNAEENESAEYQHSGNERNGNEAIGGGDDDGFESLNGKSSSGEEMSALNNNTEAIGTNATESGDTTIRSNQQYVNSAYENDANHNSNNDQINRISENVSFS